MIPSDENRLFAYKKCYTKKIAFDSLNSLEKLIFFTGAYTMYLDHEEWRPHFRFYHPVTWFVLLTILVTDRFETISIRDLFKPSNKIVSWYKDAPLI